MEILGRLWTQVNTCIFVSPHYLHPGILLIVTERTIDGVSFDNNKGICYVLIMEVYLHFSGYGDTHPYVDGDFHPSGEDGQLLRWKDSYPCG